MARQLKKDLLRGPGIMAPAAGQVGHRGQLITGDRSGPTPPSLTGRRFLSYEDLIALGIRFSRVHLRRLELIGAFPKHVKLGGGNATQTSIAWLADEICVWIDSRIDARGGAQ
jgi:predicted DNA-binding transcriptional regulator AlpA